MSKPRSKKYIVVGPHKVDGVSPGEVVDRDPAEQGTQRLLARGQIAAAPPRQSGAAVEGVPVVGPSDEKEEV